MNKLVKIYVNLFGRRVGEWGAQKKKGRDKCNNCM